MLLVIDYEVNHVTFLHFLVVLEDNFFLHFVRYSVVIVTWSFKRRLVVVDH